uniref:Histone-lysine N-methyltransferase SETMAR n=1 Tax=Caenorhabditis japonica TaxID=281687 RepID=A0A8R1IC43_CAEJA
MQARVTACQSILLTPQRKEFLVDLVTGDESWDLNWGTVPHPPYSSDVAPSDFYLFRPLKLFLKEKRFGKYEDFKMAVFDFFDSKSAAFWKKSIKDLHERWPTVVTNDGQYIVD